MIGFTHVFAGIGGAGSNVVDGITSDVVKVRINPGLYLLRTEAYTTKMRSFFSSLPENSILWIVTEDKPVNAEILRLIAESSPEGTTRLAYVFTPYRELVKEKKPEWASLFDTVFYDSLWEFLDEKKPLSEAYREASGVIARALTSLHFNLEGQMLINIDYADFFAVVKGGNVGILRLLRKVNFDWHWGIWDRGIVMTLVREDVELKAAHSVLKKFHDLLREKDIIWGMTTEKGTPNRMEILALLVKRWGDDGGAGESGTV
ncbi:hypothetical protein A3L09_00555 [Thermococcus profundus]|uniref:Uncharacterized protein n=1 Tax=Thermococcus profundus TaxID=49899 RepID=A0A2Z2MBD9_THEPR|nr:hypothetical protein A3L09_00555 [Thermococcus profundus]